MVLTSVIRYIIVEINNPLIRLSRIHVCWLLCKQWRHDNGLMLLKYSSFGITRLHGTLCGYVDGLAVCFRGRSLDTKERDLQQAVNAMQEWATGTCFKFVAHKCKVIHFTSPRYRIKTVNTFLSVEESTNFLVLWWISRLSFKKHISVLKTQCMEALNLNRVVTHIKWGVGRDTLNDEAWPDPRQGRSSHGNCRDQSRIGLPPWGYPAFIIWWSLHWWLQNERHRGGSGSLQPTFPEWWDNLPPAV